MSRRWWVAIGAVLVLTVVLAIGVVAVAADEGERVAARPAPSSIPAPNADVSKAIYGGGRAYVGDGRGGAGWIDPTQLGGGRDPKVYNDAGNQIGYWVDNLGFVDVETHDSPSYDPNALRVARFGTDGVQEWDRLKSDFEACVATHTVPECARAAGG